MRNASDIFCLNEEGTDGMQMFSVNGSCPMRIKRRHQNRENDCFEYGRPPSNPELSLGRGDINDDKFDSGEKSNTDEIDVTEDHKVDISQNLQASPNGDQKKNSELQFDAVNKPSGSQEKLTSSTIMRNPLTGAGMEIKEYRKPKKGTKNINGKWMW